MAVLADSFSRLPQEVYLNSQGLPVLDTQAGDGKIKLTEGYKLTPAGIQYCKDMGVERDGDSLRKFINTQRNTSIVMGVFLQELDCVPA